ncbi:MAG: Maf family nucleotide pyrophosphatase [Patescibacteria group bacterium]
MKLVSKQQQQAMQEAEPPLHIILASQSIGRRSLLEKLGIRFRVVVSRVDEDSIQDKDPHKMIKKRAAAKAAEVAKNPRVYMLDESAKNLIIAADSMAIVGKKTYGKAKDREHAKVILKDLMGKAHTFTTAVTVYYLEGHAIKKVWDKSHHTKVHLRKLSPAEVDSYVSRFDFTRFAAGYALNETPWDLVVKVDGSFTNVIGLPFEVILPILRQVKAIV